MNEALENQLWIETEHLTPREVDRLRTEITNLLTTIRHEKLLEVR